MTMKEFKRYINKAIEVKRTLVKSYTNNASYLGAERIIHKAKLEELEDIQKVINL